MVLHFLRFKFQLLSTSAMELTVIKVTGCNGIMRLQRVTRDNSGLQGIRGGTRGLQGVTVGYKELQGLQEITGCDERLKGETWGYRGAQGATGGYNKNLGNYSNLAQQKLISFNRISRRLVFTIKMKNVSNP